ncbi:hypothetical protein LCGC14_2223380 [marine sediment metagenome]|uniref:Uncharacterized protein n=1 Tax=marine sediment metagenome TaxID=412755 RepID=A0A0F9FMV7_9ZZZZ
MTDEQLLREALGALKAAERLGNRVAERDPFLFAMAGSEVIVRSRATMTKLEQRLLRE